MKIKAIARICAQEQRIVIMDKRNADGEISEQWIGDGSAMYPILDLPEIDEKIISTIFDIPEKKRNSYYFHRMDAPETIQTEDAVACENLLEIGKMDITIAGRTLKSVHTQHGIAFFDGKYLAPVAESMDTLEIYERLQTDGQVYLAAKAGFMLLALIMPYDIISKEFVEHMQDLTRQCDFALQNKQKPVSFEAMAPEQEQGTEE